MAIVLSKAESNGAFGLSSVIGVSTCLLSNTGEAKKKGASGVGSGALVRCPGLRGAIADTGNLTQLASEDAALCNLSPLSPTQRSFGGVGGLDATLASRRIGSLIGVEELRSCLGDRRPDFCAVS